MREAEFETALALRPQRFLAAVSDAQVAEIAGSIRAFGFTNPILVGEQGDVVLRSNNHKIDRVNVLHSVFLKRFD